MVQHKEMKTLLAQDQLKEQCLSGTVFQSFIEGPISFDPTYKYDNDSTSYDSRFGTSNHSEKARAPAWTDRVLFKGDNIKLVEYARGEQLMSDHRPGMLMTHLVRAMFEIKVRTLDMKERERIHTELFKRRQQARNNGESEAEVPLSTAVTGSRNEIDDLLGLGEKTSLARASPSIEEFIASLPPPANRLPPPSSDNFKWWERNIDVSTIPFQGSETNPFFDFDLKPRAAPPVPSKSSKMVSVNLMD